MSMVLAPDKKALDAQKAPKPSEDPVTVNATPAAAASPVSSPAPTTAGAADPSLAPGA
jgi:hypothetical protein